MKKILVLTLALALTLSNPIISSAQSPVNEAAEQDMSYGLRILEDTDKIKIVETRDTENIYVTTHDKENHTIQMTLTNIKTNDTKVGDKVLLPTTKEESEIKFTASSGEKTYTNYEYKITFGKPNVWEITRPDGNFINKKYFNIKETKKNKGDLDKYKDIVKKINSVEGEIIKKHGIAIIADLAAAASGAGAIFSGGTATPAAWAGITAAVGANALAIETVEKWDSLCKDAYEQYYTIFYAYDTY